MTLQEYSDNIKKLNHYTELYDAGTPEISDEEWDSLYFDCCQFEQENKYVDPKSPSNSIQFDIKNSLRKVTHEWPMLSLDKTQKVSQIFNWAKRFPTIVMAKLDGLTCRLTYENGKLVAAETRGNGYVGEDVLHNAKTIPSIPKSIPYKEKFIIDGEVLCTYKDFENFSDEYKNPRNFAAGSIRLMDANECAKRSLTFVSWDIISSQDNFDVKLSIMEKYKFTVVPYEFVCLDNFEEQQNRLKERCASLSYPIDGLVYRIIDQKIWTAQGRVDHHFKGSFAFKFSNVYYSTNLININWSIGRTGVITPVAEFEPVTINGACIRNASLHNLTIMREILGDHPYVGQPIKVCLANEIIPQLQRI